MTSYMYLSVLLLLLRGRAPFRTAGDMKLQVEKWRRYQWRIKELHQTKDSVVSPSKKTKGSENSMNRSATKSRGSGWHVKTGITLNGQMFFSLDIAPSVYYFYHCFVERQRRVRKSLIAERKQIDEVNE